MKRITKIGLVALGLVFVAGLAGVVPGLMPLTELLPAAQAAGDNTLTVDVACDCRTGSPAFFNGNRGDAFIVQGKIFPAETLPSGTASNDPTESVNGVASIGNWICRGQVAGTFPPEVAAVYTLTRFAYNTQYYILNDSRALTLEGYELLTEDVLSAGLAVTGGIGGFRGHRMSELPHQIQYPARLRTRPLN